MEVKEPHEFKHTSLAKNPMDPVGVTLLDEEPGFTGIYLRDANGGLWPARTVNRSFVQHHREVCEAWLARDGAEDKRTGGTP